MLKHFNWPEQKADALREAAFGYSDLKKLVSEASSLRDDRRQPCASVFKKMQALLEKYGIIKSLLKCFYLCNMYLNYLYFVDYTRLEHGVYNLSRARESATKRYKLYHIPIDWMLDSGFVTQVIYNYFFLTAVFLDIEKVKETSFTDKTVLALSMVHCAKACLFLPI